jgi:hypothetical protein
MGLLPKGYDHEQASNSGNGGLFIKLQPGENKVRILGLRLLFQTWSLDNRPIRYRASVVDGKLAKPKHLPFNGRVESRYGDEKWKHIWYCLVWSYTDQDLKVLEVSQSTVQEQLSALDSDDDWGSLDSYDVKIIRTGELMETKYSVIGVPPKPIAKPIKDALASASINLDAIVYGTYPDDPEWSDKATTKLLDNLQKASVEAAKRGIELDIPTTTDLSELQTAWEKAMDALPLQKVSLPVVEAEEPEPEDQSVVTGVDATAIPF